LAVLLLLAFLVGHRVLPRRWSMEAARPGRGETRATAGYPSGRPAPVAQWIEQRFPKPRALVRFRPGALRRLGGLVRVFVGGELERALERLLEGGVWEIMSYGRSC